MKGKVSDASTERKHYAELLARFKAPMPSVEERKAAGKALRAKVPHERHADYRPAPKRDDPIAILEEQAKTRHPFLVPDPLRPDARESLCLPAGFGGGDGGRSGADPRDGPDGSGLRRHACRQFRCLRIGRAQPRVRDQRFRRDTAGSLGVGPQAPGRQRRRGGAASWAGTRSCARTQPAPRSEATASACANTPRWGTWMSGTRASTRQDILAASIAGGAEDRRADHGQGAGSGATCRCSRRWRSSWMTGTASSRTDPSSSGRRTRRMAGPSGRRIAQTLERYVDSLPDERRTLFARYRIVDVARKVVGVGSVGTRCWVVLMDGNGPDDPLFLQYKEAQPSVLAPYSKTPRWECEGKRVVVGQRLIQGAPDIFLGWGTQPNRKPFLYTPAPGHEGWRGVRPEQSA